MLVVSLGAALAVFSMKRGKNFIRSALFATFLVPPVVASVIFKLMFGTESGLINTVLNTLGLPSVGWLISPGWALAAIIIVHVWNGTGYYMVIFLAGLSNINRQLYEAARVDGAKPWQLDRYITLPLMKNVVGTCVVLASVAMVSQFDIIYVTTKGGPGTATLNLPIYLYKTATLENNYGKAKAVGVVQILVGLVLVVLIQGLFAMGKEKIKKEVK